VVVYGAYGHTGRFVVGELLRRGPNPVLSGRDPDRLAGLAAEHPGVVARAASIESPSALDRAAVDDIGRSAQTFLLEAIVRRGPEG
jgi:short subunit dehydrogenase-like uncharacterized protein